MDKLPITIIANAQVSFNSMGGSDKIFIELARVWIRSSYSVKVMGCREAGVMCRKVGLGDNFQEISAFDVEEIGLARAYILRTIFAARFKKNIPEGIAYSSSDFLPDSVFAFFQKILDKKLLWAAGIFLIARNPLVEKEARNINGFIYWITQRIAIFLMKLAADMVVVLCEEDKCFLERSGIPKNKITVIPAGINMDEIGSSMPQEKLYDACFVGRFHHQKGIPELISIWRKVADSLPGAKLGIVGWGSAFWQGRINKLILENNLNNNISLLGFLDGNAKYDIIKSSRVFLFTSLYESWGIVVAEALGCACPVVAFDIPATRRFKKGLILVEPDDLELFAGKVIFLLNNESERLSYAKMAQEESACFTWNKPAGLIMQGLHN